MGSSTDICVSGEYPSNIDELVEYIFGRGLEVGTSYIIGNVVTANIYVTCIPDIQTLIRLSRAVATRLLTTTDVVGASINMKYDESIQGFISVNKMGTVIGTFFDVSIGFKMLSKSEREVMELRSIGGIAGTVVDLSELASLDLMISVELGGASVATTIRVERTQSYTGTETSAGITYSVSSVDPGNLPHVLSMIAPTHEAVISMLDRLRDTLRDVEDECLDLYPRYLSIRARAEYVAGDVCDVVKRVKRVDRGVRWLIDTALGNNCIVMEDIESAIRDAEYIINLVTNGGYLLTTPDTYHGVESLELEYVEKMVDSGRRVTRSSISFGVILIDRETDKGYRGYPAIALKPFRKYTRGELRSLVVAGLAKSAIRLISRKMPTRVWLMNSLQN